MVKEILLELGLIEKEVDFYLLILKHGELTAGNISKISKESRTHVYDSLNKLLYKGLITYVVKNNVKYFKVTPITSFLDYLNNKESKIKEERKRILKILPEIKKLQNSSRQEEFNIDVYDGGEGIKTIMNDILREGKSFITWGATSKVKEYVPEFFINRYLNERKRKRIRAKQLFTDFYGVLESPLSDNRKLPKEYSSPTTTLVYGNKISTFFWLEIPKVVLINNKDLAKSYRKYFNLMWGAAGVKFSKHNLSIIPIKYYHKKQPDKQEQVF